MEITAKTLPTFIIGNPISHSKSPVFQNAAFNHCNINSVYLAINIEKNDFEAVIAGLKKINIFGMNITIPYKVDILKYVDELSEDAKLIGAVNTIEVLNGNWVGHNTDWYGVYKTLELNKLSPSQDCLIIGAGGATNGVIYGLQQYGVKNIAITNRTKDKAELIKDQFNIDLIDFEEYKSKIKNYSLIINTTSIDFNKLVDSFLEDKTYFDLKYYSGKIDMPNYIDGKIMLLYQGAKAFEIWTKQEAPIEIMQKAMEG
ncbi:MAG: shikimate dehydrogenase [Spirochaetes bacterium GWD1_27_9]|nr:MAG: shikimate dehydrogenase [Spirochaetes bacterium GWB1_27_13]OHD23314.1 MAG: shikimate dehydrogenase [Spirochaetes bacterium GWC1_27_15]OHD32310.1 MAG: shikimate dehydrogenase [Spirochaetes bacterium GWD1_27_9]